MRQEIGNILEEFKIEILNSLRSQLDTLQMKKEEEKKKSGKECPLDHIKVCGICSEDHATHERINWEHIRIIKYRNT